MNTPAEPTGYLVRKKAALATLSRLKKETPALDVEALMDLSVHARNKTAGPNGFSPFQWFRGADPPEELEWAQRRPAKVESQGESGV